jgi:hypothetical protein
MPNLHLSTFRADVTPPIGHPLCGGWIKPAIAVDDPLEAVGVILLGMGRPIVLCVVDWCGLRNDANRLWREALAAAVQTVPECVALHCVHPHNTPFADVGAEKLIEAAHAPPSLDLKFYEQAVKRCADAARASLARTRRWTHAGFGQAKVEQVASNRRVLGPDGTVKIVRYSSSKDPKSRAASEGLIDPFLRTLSFWDGDRPLAALSYYATHPMSYYGDGRVSADFCGLARRKRQDDDKDVFQVFFNGCAGNVTAGKYNDGSHEFRAILRDRVYAGMVGAWKSTERFAVDHFNWRVEPVQLSPRAEPNFGADESRAVLNDPKATAAKRDNAAFQLAWLARKDRPIDLTCLSILPPVSHGGLSVLHLPGEPFVEYQLFARDQRPDINVCVAGYGDGGPGYIPTARAFQQGGYEPTVALAAPESETVLQAAIRKLLK